MQLFLKKPANIVIVIMTCISLLYISDCMAEEELFVYEDNGKRDPFWRLVSPSGAIINYEKDLLLTDMVLEGIMLGKDGRNIAIINGMIVQQGDKIGLFILEKIDKDTIILQKEQERFTLKLKKGE